MSGGAMLPGGDPGAGQGPAAADVGGEMLSGGAPGAGQGPAAADVGSAMLLGGGSAGLGGGGPGAGQRGAHPVLTVEGLSVGFEAGGGLRQVVQEVGFEVAPGEVLAIVGESGSGKSVTLKACLHLLATRPGVLAGQVRYRFGDGAEVSVYEGLPATLRLRRGADGAPVAARVSARFEARVERRLRGLRGTRVGLALQDGRAALDPFWTVGQQLRRALRRAGCAPATVHEEATRWLSELGFSDPKRVAAARPHQLSGGMAQRAMLAVVLARAPELLLLDEVSTGLDVSLQAAVLELLARLQQQVGFSAVLVTHDLGVARSVSERVLIMREGRVVEQADTEALFSGRLIPSDYTGRLLDLGHHEAVSRLSPVNSALPGAAPPPAPPPAPAQAKVQLRGVAKRFGALSALSALDLALAPGRCLALVGESGSGKTTLARIIAGLSHPSGGEVRWDGRPLASLSAAEVRAFQRRRAVLFQNPYTSLNPQATPLQLLVEGRMLHQGMAKDQAQAEAKAALAQVQLAGRADQPLGSLSGGERRRVGLLRTLASGAELLLLDEPTAGLDAEHRGLVQQLIRQARAAQPELSVLLVSHDLGFVMGVADRVVVLYRGQLVEDLEAADFSDLAYPHHPYTQELWDASRFVAGVAPPVTPPPPPPPGLEAAACPYCPRCPIYARHPNPRCLDTPPALQAVSPRRRLACHGLSPGP